MTSTESGLAVLVVDDDPVSLMVTSHILEAGGCDVIRASSAAEARSSLAARRTPFDVVVCDHLMPDETGLDLIENLHENGVRPERFLLLTGAASEDELADARTRLVDAFLVKPVQSAALLAAVTETHPTGTR